MARRRPVLVVGSVAVKASFGHGSRQALGSIGSHARGSASAGGNTELGDVGGAGAISVIGGRLSAPPNSVLSLAVSNGDVAGLSSEQAVIVRPIKRPRPAAIRRTARTLSQTRCAPRQRKRRSH